MNIFQKWRQVKIDRVAADEMAILQNDYAEMLLHLLESGLPLGAQRRSVIVYWIVFRNETLRRNTRAAEQSRRHMRRVFLAVLRDIRERRG